MSKNPVPFPRGQTLREVYHHDARARKNRTSLPS